MRFAHLLSTPADAFTSSFAALKQDHPAAWGAFTAELAQLQRDIKARNAALMATNEAPYLHLAPENMLLSIDT